MAGTHDTRPVAQRIPAQTSAVSTSPPSRPFALTLQADSSPVELNADTNRPSLIQRLVDSAVSPPSPPTNPGSRLEATSSTRSPFLDQMSGGAKSHSPQPLENEGLAGFILQRTPHPWNRLHKQNHATPTAHLTMQQGGYCTPPIPSIQAKLDESVIHQSPNLHVVHQNQDQARPRMQAKGIPLNDDQPTNQMDFRDHKSMQAETFRPQLQAKSIDSRLTTPSSTPLIQRQAGIPKDTHVQVNDGSSIWYGQITNIDDDNDTYTVRVGGTTDREVVVPQTQVDYHDVVEAMSPQQVAMQRWVATLPVIDIPGDMGALGGDVLGAQIVTAQGQMTQDQDTAAHTIAMFEYMDRNANGIGNRILTDFAEIPIDQVSKRNKYLQALSSAMHRKIGRTLWMGDEDRGMIALGLTNPTIYFGKGKRLLLSKAQDALNADKTLVALLENHSHNLEAKSYGRRQESMCVLAIDALPGRAADPPQVGVPVPHDQAGYAYVADDYITPVAANALQPDTDYILTINNGVRFLVTVQANQADSVIFSAVKDY